MLDSILVFFKGFWIGGTMTVPGVSGGSMAMILNIYDRLITAIASLRKDPKKNIIFLLKFLIGAAYGIFLFSKYVIAPCLQRFPLPVSYFFLGAVAGGIPIIVKTAGVKKFSCSVVAYPIVGAILVLLIAILPKGVFAPQEGFQIWDIFLQFLGGFIVAAALILPGISVSQILYMLGLYEELMVAINNFRLLPFLPLGIGVLLGTFLCAKFMDKAMQKFPQPTYLVVFGFLLGSLPQLFPGFPIGLGIPLCLVAFLAGFAFIFGLQKFEQRKSF